MYGFLQFLFIYSYTNIIEVRFVSLFVEISGTTEPILKIISPVESYIIANKIHTYNMSNIGYMLPTLYVTYVYAYILAHFTAKSWSTQLNC